MKSNFGAENILSVEELKEKVKSLKKEGAKVGLCQGTFDLVHPGHVAYLSEASKHCDVLIVAVSNDEFVSERKGRGRPILPAKLNAYTLANLSFVCYVVITPYDRASPLIKLLKPDFYIKGIDYKNKTTSGITEERAAIKSVGGRMIYTSTPKLSTTKIIKHIQEKVKKEKLLLVLDRDGTLVELVPWLGKNRAWKKQVKLKTEVINFIQYLQQKYDCKTIVASNQLGVARRLFTCGRVEAINRYIHKLLKAKGVSINAWRFCPSADWLYTNKHPEINWDRKYVATITARKPDTEMIPEKLNSFDKVIVIGDSKDDKGLAKNLNATFIDVNKGGQKTWTTILKD